MHSVYSSFGDKNLDTFSECELCRRLPNACIANCDSVSIANKTKLVHSDDSIDRSIFEIMAIDTSIFSSDSFDIQH